MNIDDICDIYVIMCVYCIFLRCFPWRSVVMVWFVWSRALHLALAAPAAECWLKQEPKFSRSGAMPQQESE